MENVKIFVKETFKKNIFWYVEKFLILHNASSFGTMKYEVEKQR